MITESQQAENLDQSVAGKVAAIRLQPAPRKAGGVWILKEERRKKERMKGH